MAEHKEVDCGIYQHKMRKLMDEIGDIIRQIASSSCNDNLYRYNISKQTINPNDINFLYPLIHTICSNGNRNIHSVRNQKNYHLPFPLFEVNKTDDDYDEKWNLDHNGIVYCFSANIFKYSYWECIASKEYTISKQNKCSPYIVVKSGKLKSKSDKVIQKIMVNELEGHLEKIKTSSFFYRALNYIAYNESPEDKDILPEFVHLLKDKEDLLKIINILAKEELEKPIFDELNKNNIKISLNDPLNYSYLQKNR